VSVAGGRRLAAKRLKIEGRSSMSKAQLERAISRAR